MRSSAWASMNAAAFRTAAAPAVEAPFTRGRQRLHGRKPAASAAAQVA
jgi:hypothetical protein